MTTSVLGNRRKTAHFAANATNATIAGDSADPDADGLVNLIEYALGGDPNLRTPGPTPSLTGLNFTRNLTANDITLIVEATTNLVTGWSTIASNLNATGWLSLPGVNVIDTGNGAVSVVESNSMPMRFYRLHVSHP